jgi:hypothetical protein
MEPSTSLTYNAHSEGQATREGYVYPVPSRSTMSSIGATATGSGAPAGVKIEMSVPAGSHGQPRR